MSVVRINIPSKNALPDMWDEVRPDFPMPSPRKFQDDALNVIYWALKNDDFDNIVIQAPTGIGKSRLPNNSSAGLLDRAEPPLVYSVVGPGVG